MGEPFAAAAQRQRRARTTGLLIGGLIVFMLGGVLGISAYAIVAIVAALFVLARRGPGAASRM